jgi:mRNA interferase MazF
MHRGDLYRVYRGSRVDSKKFRVFVIVSREALIQSHFSTVICAPIYSRFDGLSTQLQIGISEGLKSTSSVFCDELVSIEKSKLTHFVGSLSSSKLNQLEQCLNIALE